MIGYIKGEVVDQGDAYVVVAANGLGYKLHCSQNTLSAAPQHYWVETVFTQEKITLYGFANKAEQAWFLKLTNVPGVGSRVALALLSALSPAQLEQAIFAQDKKALTAADGVGPKLASRLLTELKDKVVASSLAAKPLPANQPGTAPSHAQEALMALVSLGYDSFKAQQALANVEEADSADMVKSALKQLAAA